MPAVTLASIVDDSQIGPLQKVVLALCASSALLDGFDTQAIGYTGPAIATTIGVASTSLGTVFAAGTVGITLGAFGLGPVADRVGRRRLLIACVTWFAAFTLITPLITTLPQLLGVRVLAGLGLGGAMPSFVALAAEYIPARMCNVVIAGIYAAFPFGGLVGGLVSFYVIPRFSWQPIFIVGGITPLFLAAALYALLPESVRFLLVRRRSLTEARRLAGTIRGWPMMEDETLVDAVASRDGRLFALFGQGLWRRTLLLWGAFMMSYMVLLTVGVWSTALLHDAGVGIVASLLVVSCNYLGSVAGSVLIGYAMDRLGSIVVIGLGFALGAACLAAVGQATASVPLMALLLTAAGLCTAGPASGLIAIAAQSYPTEVRSTGIGWAMGAGRFGQIVGPLGIGLLVAGGWHADGIFIATAVPCVVAALLVWLLARLHSPACSA